MFLACIVSKLECTNGINMNVRIGGLALNVDECRWDDELVSRDPGDADNSCPLILGQVRLAQ
jgi:hypothetical protein